MLQRCIAIMLTLSMFFTFMTPKLSAGDSYYEYAKESLMETEKGAEYIDTLENIIPQLSDDKLSEIAERVELAMFENTNIPDDMYVLLEFIAISIELEIDSRRVIIQELEPTEQEKAQKEILKMQKHLGNSINTMMEDLVAEWNSLSRYKESGDFTMTMEGEMPEVGSLDLKFNVDNYVNENQSFDNRFTGDISGSMNISAYGEEESISGKSFVDLINTDGSLYMLFRGLDFEMSEVDDYTSLYMDKLKDLAKTNTYVKSSNIDMEALLYFLGSTSLSEIKDTITDLENRAMLEAYTKRGNTYILRPTKDFCDTMKGLAGIFDPFGGDTCTENQYKDMLDEFYEENISIELSIGKESTLSLNLEDEYVMMNMNTTWDKAGMLSMSMDMDAGEDGNFAMTWIMGESMSMNFDIEDVVGSMEIMFANMTTINSVEASMSYDDDDEKMNFDLSYKNETLESSFEYSDYLGTIACTLGGPLKSDFAELSMGCDIQNDSIAYLGTGSDTIKINGDFEYDGKDGKNDLDINIQVTSGEAYLNIMARNIGERRATSERDIPAPENFIDAWDLQDEIFDELYGDFDDTSF